MKKVAIIAACCLSLCFLGAYLSGCAKDIGTDGFVRVRKETPAGGGVINRALYQRKGAIGVGQPVYVLSLSGHYQSIGTLNETD